MKQFYTFNGAKVFIVKPLVHKTTVQTPKGNKVKETPVVDKEGAWVQVEFEDGCRKPVAKENLISV